MCIHPFVLNTTYSLAEEGRWAATKATKKIKTEGRPVRCLFVFL